MNQLEKLNQTVQMFEELGLPISRQQLDAIREAEISILKQDVIPFIKSAIEEQTQLFRNKYELSVVCEPNKGVDIKFVERAVQPTLPIPSGRNVPHQKKDKLIKITFPDGQVVQPNKLLDATIAVIEYAGPQRVQDLGIKLNGENLIRDNMDINEKRPQAFKRLSTGQYVYTNCDFKSKLSQIKTINERLHLDLKIEVVYL